ncbi:alpha-amylase [bacterium]|nr:alpha-amylase [bacterium]
MLCLEMSKRASFFCRNSFLAFLFTLQLLPIEPMLGATPKIFVDSQILLQAFGWNSMNNGVPSRWYQLLGERASDIKEFGFSTIWLPPISRSVSPQGYMPGDYYDIGEKGTPTFYGDREQLQDCLKKLHSARLLVLEDIVINHRCAGKQDSNGIWNQYSFPSNKAAWSEWAICHGEFGGTGHKDTGFGFAPAPDIDHFNQTVQGDIVSWMLWLKQLGFDGWRYDFVKGFDPKFVSLFDSRTRPFFSVGELWTDMSYQGSSLNYDQNAHRQLLCDWLNSAGKTATAFDFTTKGILQAAVNGEYWRLKDPQGKAPGLIGWWPERSVTFIENHDTGSQQGFWPFPKEKVLQGYAYILTHPGIPCVFWEHLYDWNLKKDIKDLIEIRRRNGISSKSSLIINKAEDGLYAAIIDEKLAVKLGWKDWNPGPPFSILCSGEQYAVWARKRQ